MTAYKLLSRLRYLTLVENGWKGTLQEWNIVHLRDELWTEVLKMRQGNERNSKRRTNIG